MVNHFDKRTTDPQAGARRQLGHQPDVQLLYRKTQEDLIPKISKYAYGKDYHFVLKRKLKSLFLLSSGKDRKVEGAHLSIQLPVWNATGRAAPTLGWMGKNTMLIHPRAGSYFFLAR